MLLYRQQIDAALIIAETLEYKFPEQFSEGFSLNPFSILDVLEGHLYERYSVESKQFNFEVTELDGEAQHRLIWALKQLKYSELVSLALGLDYNLELRTEREIISEENYPILFRYISSLPGINDAGLVNENHGMGYHIHYVYIKKKKQNRTDVLFTFDPSELTVSNHILYWEHHGSGVKSNPKQFGKRRCQAVYDTSCGFLSKVPKHSFRSPGKGADVLWPQ